MIIDHTAELTSRVALRPMSALQGVGLAGLSNAIAACCTNPVDVVKVRMQLAGVKELTACEAHTVLAATRKLWRTEGLPGLYRGLAPSVLRELSYSGVRMGLYEPVREALLRAAPFAPALLVKIAAGACTGAIGSVLANPFDLLKVRMQGAERQVSDAWMRPRSRVCSSYGKDDER